MRERVGIPSLPCTSTGWHFRSPEANNDGDLPAQRGRGRAPGHAVLEHSVKDPRTESHTARCVCIDWYLYTLAELRGIEPPPDWG